MAVLLSRSLRRIADDMLKSTLIVDDRRIYTLAAMSLQLEQEESHWYEVKFQCFRSAIGGLGFTGS